MQEKLNILFFHVYNTVSNTMISETEMHKVMWMLPQVDFCQEPQLVTDPACLHEKLVRGCVSVQAFP